MPFRVIDFENMLLLLHILVFEYSYIVKKKVWI
jgi:hypothetical protein